MKPSIWIWLGAILLTGASGHTDTWKLVGPRIFASDGHEYALQVPPIPNRTITEPVEGKLFGFTPNGEQRIFWRGKLVNNPVSAYVADPSTGEAPRFATVD